MSRSVKITTIPLRGLPNYCWIRKAQGNYELHAPKDSIHSLPKVLKKYKPVLDELGLGYREVTGVAGIQFLEYWNPEHYKKKELCLHEYAWIPISKGYYDTRRSHKEMVLDNETYKKAGEIQEKVELSVKNYEKKLQLEELLHWCKEQLGENSAVGVIVDRKFSLKYDVEQILDNEDGQIYFRGFKVIKGQDAYGRWGDKTMCVIFNLKKIEEMPTTMEMKVPEGTQGLFIGKKGYWTNQWRELLYERFGIYKKFIKVT